MATDNSPPKIRVILTIAFSSVVILGALHFVFQSYWQMMTEEVEQERLRPAEQLIALREGEAKNLASGPMPIAAAMKTLAERGRGDALKEIAPEPSNDMGPMVGWVKTPNQAVIDALTAAQADAGSAAAPPPGDGGAQMAATDGGTPMNVGGTNNAVDASAMGPTGTTVKSTTDAGSAAGAASSIPAKIGAPKGNPPTNATDAGAGTKKTAPSTNTGPAPTSH